MEWLLLKVWNKAQVFSADTLLGLIVFLFALSIVFFYFNQLFQRDVALQEDFELENFSFNALSGLVETSGFPENWQALEVSRIGALGLASERNVLDAGKLSRFLEISESDYNSVKNSLGLQKFDFRFSVSDLNGGLLRSAGSSKKAVVSFKASRLAVWEKRVVLVSLEAFK